jgi:hypothetical protein
VYAGLETRLELAWVSAACLAVAVRVATWIGMLALAMFLALVAIVHLRRRGGLLSVRPVGSMPLAERLLLRAETLAAHNYHDEAIVVALSALEEGRGEAADPAIEVTPERAAEIIERVRNELDEAAPPVT